MTSLDKQPQPELQRFVDARGRPALFLFAAEEPLWRSHVISMYDLLAERKFDELDLVIHSGGGSAHAAYQVIELLRLHTARLNACVPFWAKSAATLLCIGADKIVLGEHAELGPLDVQIYEEKKAGKGQFISALNLFKTVEQLQTASIEALASAMRFVVDEYEMSYDESLSHAVAFVGVTTGPLVANLDPEKLGQYNRELSVAIEYGTRLLTRYGSRNRKEAGQLAEKLVYGYPSHEYIIDYKELQDLGLQVELFEQQTERPAAKQLISHTERDFVTFVEPTPSTAGVEGVETDFAEITRAGAGLNRETSDE